MIELIYNEEGETAAGEKEIWEPKNFRQIGEPEENKKIFIEDYVHTFLQQYSERQGNENAKMAVLLGTCEKSGGKKHLYIKSALAVENVLQKDGRYEFSQKLWGEIYRQCGQYFSGQNIVGWFMSRPGFPIESGRLIEETQKTYFSGADKVFMMLEPIEGETGFFAFGQNRFERQSGYYIYYEKNEPMHIYMMEKNLQAGRTKPTEKPERAVANFRRALQEKQEMNVRRKKRIYTYTMRAGAAALLLAGGVAFYGQWKETMIPEMKETAADISEKEFLGGEVVVEELPGNVEEQKETLPETEKPEEELPVSGEGTAAENPPQETEAAEQPEEKPPVEEAAAEEAPVCEEYMVQRGDTLARILRQKYGDTEKIPEICELNGIENGDYIQEGEIILLP